MKPAGQAKSAGQAPKPAGPTSSRRQAVQKPGTSSGRVKGSGRTRPQEEGETDPMLKKVFFYGTGALFVLVIALLIVKWDALTAPPKQPPKKVVINENDKIDAAEELAKKAAMQFVEAKKIKDDAARDKAIQAAIDTLNTAQERLEAMSDKYKGEDYDQVFEPRLNRIIQERKQYRDALHRTGVK
jgi:hypothetical protein